MKYSFLLLALYFVPFFVYGQANDDNAFMSNSYNKKTIKDNNIDTISVIIDVTGKLTKRFYVFDILGNLTHTMTFDDNEKKTSESLLHYNIKGQLISKKDNEEDLINDTTTFFHNANGQLVRSVTKDKDDGEITVSYYYDKQKLVEETRKEKTGKLITKYKYDNQGRLSDVTTLTLRGKDIKGIIAIHKVISYDNRGNKSFEEITFLTKDTVKYQYDEKNKLILVQKGKDTEKYFYNDIGLLIQKDVIKFLLDSPMTYTEKYRYVIRQ